MPFDVSLSGLELRPAAGYFPYRSHHGAVAQLGERRVRNAKVVGSNPIGSTTFYYKILIYNVFIRQIILSVI